MGRIWSAEMEGTGVRFLTVDPGEMDTRMHADAIPEADRSKLADPKGIAIWIADLIGDAEAFLSGARLELAALPGAEARQ